MIIYVMKFAVELKTIILNGNNVPQTVRSLQMISQANL